MKKMILKNTDLEVSNICYGTGNFGEKLNEEQAFEALDTFVEAGGNFIDTANCYCRWVPGNDNTSEHMIGNWLKSRDAYNKVVIATKGCHHDFGNPEINRVNKECLHRDLDESLTTLGLDQIDFYWMHRDNEDKPIEEIIDMMEDLKKEGKIRFYGASNYKLYRMKQADEYAKRMGYQGFSAVSNQYSFATVNEGCNINQDPTLALMNPEYYKWHKETGMPIVCYTSTALGFFEKLDREIPISEEMKKAYINNRNMEALAQMQEMKAKTGKSVMALSIAALTNQPFQTIPVAAVSRLEQLDGILEGSDIVLPEDFIKRYEL